MCFVLDCDVLYTHLDHQCGSKPRVSCFFCIIEPCPDIRDKTEKQTNSCMKLIVMLTWIQKNCRGRKRFQRICVRNGMNLAGYGRHLTTCMRPRKSKHLHIYKLMSGWLQKPVVLLQFMLSYFIFFNFFFFSQFLPMEDWRKRKSRQDIVSSHQLLAATHTV